MYKRQVLLCVLRLQEYHQLKTLVHEVDPDAFLVVSETAQILGEGFKPINTRR